MLALAEIKLPHTRSPRGGAAARSSPQNYCRKEAQKIHGFGPNLPGAYRRDGDSRRGV